MVDFYHFARDGISFSQTYKKNMLMLGPGQREGIIVQFNKSGVYQVMQGEINDFAEDDADLGPGEGTSDVPMATFRVTKKHDIDSVDAVDLSKLTFTPGMAATLGTSEVDHHVKINFQAGTDLGKLPAPQFVIDGQPFDFRKVLMSVGVGTVAEWTIESSMNYFHPFHIHINPFQVKEFNAPSLPRNLKPYWEQCQEPMNAWRDTVFLPPLGSTRIWQRFSTGEAAWQGKTAFHCHFLDHEDQGMIAAFLIKSEHDSRTIMV